MSTSSVWTVNRWARSFARSSTSPTSRSSRVVSLATTSSDAPTSSRVVDQPVAERVDVPLDRRQRRAQLVRDGHQELALALLGRGESRRHLVEALGEVRDLVAAPADRHVHRVVARARSRPTRSARACDRAADPAREPETEQPGEEAADRERRGEAGDERQPLVADDVLRLGDDDRAERGAVRLEAERLRRRRGRSGSARAAGTRSVYGPFEVSAAAGTDDSASRSSPVLCPGNAGAPT